MSAIDLLIRNGTVVDGTGAPRRVADVGIDRGRIAFVGSEEQVTAERVVDAEGLVVAPGFVDVHTHYDAQALWDPALSPSALHGATTVIAGNCGFTLAPSAGRDVDFLQRLMAQVEGIPLEAIKAGIDWTWTTVPEYLDRIEGAVGPNIGFLAGHSAIRRHVMGDRASLDEASDGELAAMTTALREILDAGALGFSSSMAVVHKDADGRPVPSRLASVDELIRLCEEVGRSSAVAVEFTTPGSLDGFSPAEVDLMIAMSRASGCALNWNLLTVRANNRAYTNQQIGASHEAAAAGARVYALMLPHTQRLRFTLKSGVIISNIPGWDEVLALPLEERVRALGEDDVRRRLREGATAGSGYVGAVGRSIGRMELADTGCAEHRHLVGRSLAEIGDELSLSAVDALVELALADGLDAGFLSVPSEREDELWEERARAWEDPYVIVGGSDAGAHLDMMCGSVYTTHLLGDGVRERNLLSLERAVALLSGEPARMYGLRERGELRAGYAADVVVFDTATVGPRPAELRRDLPGGGARVFAASDGMRHVFVNGTAVLQDGQPTGALPGTLLRAGRDATRP